ncbi:MAG: CHAT domain-containing protein [Anaerolineae bacterium]|nr:CHAT domain-containing protein [Anaerolineae bacterium]
MPELETPTYSDILVRIFAKNETEDYYPIEAILSDGSHFTGGELHLDAQALEAEAEIQIYGLNLFYALFSGKIRAAYDVATGLAAAKTGSRLRFRLWIDAGAPELHMLAWERLCQQAQPPLATLSTMPFSRYFGLEAAEPEPAAQWPRQMVFAIANPSDLEEKLSLAPIQVEQEIRSLLEALDNPLRTGQLHLTIMPGRTGLSDELRADLSALDAVVCDGETSLETIIRRLNETPAHILHFLGHGRFNYRDGSAQLVMENRNGNAKPLKDTALAEQLAALTIPPHLVFISSCESAVRDLQNGNPFVGLAPKLVQAGVPAVIAMQDVVSISSNQQLVQEFYRYQLHHGIVDLALNQARMALYSQQADRVQSKDWTIPVLFMRLKQGQLFNRDPVRTALNAMIASSIFNPLPANEPYLPVEVQHIRNAVDVADFQPLLRLGTSTLQLHEAVEEIFDPAKAEIGPHGPSVVILVGDEGMGKSVSMRHLGLLAASQSLAPNPTRILVPVYLTLENFSRNAHLDTQAIKERILQALEPFWAATTNQTPEDLLTASTGPILRVIIDGSDTLPDHLRYRAWQALRQFIMENPRHEYIIATNPSGLQTPGLPMTDLLVMQPISRRNIQHFLTQTLKDPSGAELYAAIERARIFDLAAMPWLLFEMLRQTQRGTPPQSRSQVLRNVVTERVIAIASDKGMRARATETLYALAWEMQIHRKSVLSVEEAFTIMAQVRGKRGYDLEELYQELIHGELLEPMGEESLCFTRAILRAYCFAQALANRADRESQLDDITATLGHYNRYRWWEESLTLLSGLLDDPTALIRQILYDVPLGEGDQVFLAVRCVQECNQNVCLTPQLTGYIADILLWRLCYSSDPRIARRVRIIQALAQLQNPATLPALIEIAYPQDAPPPLDDNDFDYNSIRLAAVMALRQIVPPPYVPIANVAPRLAKLLNFWANQEVASLEPFLFAKSNEESSDQAIAAFALGDLKTPPATGALIQMFMMKGLPLTIRRNIITALSMLDTATVTQTVILPLLAPDHADESLNWSPMLAYLIGKVRAQDAVAREFLYTCLREAGDVALKGLAIQSLGWLYDLRNKKRFEDIALGDFTSLNLPSQPPAEESQFLQRKALEALRSIGDNATLRRLQGRPTTWSPELERAFYWTMEEIIARQNEK